MRKLTGVLFFSISTLLAASCGDASSGDGDVVCTLVGCAHGVAVNFDDILGRRSIQTPFTIETCLDDLCVVADVFVGDRGSPGCFTTDAGTICCTLQQQVPGAGCYVEPGSNVQIRFELQPEEAAGDLERTVSVKARDRSGADVIDEAKTIQLQALYPNGPDCDPVCYHAEVSFHQGPEAP